MTREKATELARCRAAAYAAKVDYAGRDHVWTPRRLREWERLSAELEAAEAEWRRALYG